MVRWRIARARSQVAVSLLVAVLVACASPAPPSGPPIATAPGRTTKATATTPPSAGPPTAGLAPIAADLLSPGTILLLAVQAEGRIALLRSADRGLHWRASLTNLALPIASVAGVRASGTGLRFADPDHGWLSDGRALWATADGGLRWTPARLPVAGPATIADLAVIDGRAYAYVIASAAPDSDPGLGRLLAWQGDQWQVVPGTATPAAVGGRLAGADGWGWAAVTTRTGPSLDSGALRFFATRGGRPWTSLTPPPCAAPAAALVAGWSATHLAVVCSPGTVLGSGPTATAVSTDGGQSWSGPVVGPRTGLPDQLAALAPRTLILGTAAAASALARSADGGRRWSTVLRDTARGGAVWHDLSIEPSGFGVVTLGSPAPGLPEASTLYATTDGGEAWQALTVARP